MRFPAAAGVALRLFNICSEQGDFYTIDRDNRQIPRYADTCRNRIPEHICHAAAAFEGCGIRGIFSFGANPGDEGPYGPAYDTCLAQ